MSYQVVTQPQAEEDIRQAIRWIARYSPKKPAVWYFDVVKIHKDDIRLNDSP